MTEHFNQFETVPEDVPKIASEVKAFQSYRDALTVGKFPAFEAYAFRTGSAPKALLQISPGAATAFGLIDGGTALATERRTLSVVL